MLKVGPRESQKLETDLAEQDPEKAELYEKLQKIHDVLKKKPATLERDHHNILRTLYQKVQELDFIPKRLWGKVNEMLKLKIIPRKKRLIERTNAKPQCYIVLTGRFEIRRQGEGISIEPGIICGNYHAFNDKRWKPADVVAMEDSSAAEFSPDILSQLILEENSNAQFKSLIAFLQEAIPRFDLLSRHSQERLARFFNDRIFFPGQEIIKEGSAASSAFLLRDGVCSFLSAQSPLIHSELYDSTKVSLKVNRSPIKLSPNKKINGYMSRSTNMYQFSTASAKDWMGDDIVLDIEKYQYSVIAKTRAVALEISKENLKKFPPEIMQMLILNAKAKIRVIYTRKRQLERNITNIYNMNPSFAPTKRRKSQVKESRYHSANKAVNGTISASHSFLEPKPKPSPNSSVELAYDSSYMFKPRKVLLTLASLLKPYGSRKVLLPAINKGPLVTDKAKFTKGPSYVSLRGDESKPVQHKSTFNVGCRDICLMFGEERPDTPNPSFGWSKRRRTNIIY